MTDAASTSGYNLKDLIEHTAASLVSVFAESRLASAQSASWSVADRGARAAVDHAARYALAEALHALPGSFGEALRAVVTAAPHTEPARS